MKKLLSYIAIAFLAYACTNETPVMTQTGDSPEKPALRTQEDAIKFAVNLAEARSNHSRTSAPQVQNVEVVGSMDSRSVKDTLLYAVNFEDNRGYVLVSASNYGEPIIAYSDNGSFSSKNDVENDEFDYYMDAAKNYVKSNISNPNSNIGIIVRPELPITVKSTITPRVKVEWGQDYPEGIYCPNKTSGCVQTAMAQMMTYVQQPTFIEFTYADRDYDSYYLNWTELVKHEKSIISRTLKEQHLSTCAASEEIHCIIGRLCRELGERNNAVYGLWGTESAGIDAVETFKTLHSKNKVGELRNFDSDFINLYNALENTESVAFVGGLDKNSSGGHAWVCDGGELTTKTSKFALEGGGYETVVEYTCYYHFNWGYCGDKNGYFYAGVFDYDKPSTSRTDYGRSPQFFIVYK